MDADAQVARANDTQELCANILSAQIALLADGDGFLRTTSGLPVRTPRGRAVAAWFLSPVLLTDEADRRGGGSLLPAECAALDDAAVGVYVASLTWWEAMPCVLLTAVARVALVALATVGMAGKGRGSGANQVAPEAERTAVEVVAATQATVLVAPGRPAAADEGFTGAGGGGGSGGGGGGSGGSGGSGCGSLLRAGGGHLHARRAAA